MEISRGIRTAHRVLAYDLDPDFKARRFVVRLMVEEAARKALPSKIVKAYVAAEVRLAKMRMCRHHEQQSSI